MDFIRMCLVLTLCLTLMAHVVFSAPASAGNVETLADCSPSCNAAPLALTRDRREVDSTDNSDDAISRVRRQVAQMAGSRPRYAGNRRPRYRANRGRLQGRRLYNTRRQSRTRGRVVVW